MASLVPTEEKAECFRLQLLIIDFGTVVLRHKFDQFFPPLALNVQLNQPNTRGSLENLRKRNVISAKQWDLLYPVFGQQSDSAKFDVSLICCLLLNVCGLHVQSPGWVPSSKDTSTEADITRIRLMRNKIAHLNITSMNKQQFQNSWTDLEQAILRLGTGLPSLQQDIQNLKDECLDPAKEKEYLRIIKDWEEMDKSLQQSIDEINLKVEKTVADIDNIKGVIEIDQQKSTEISKTITIYERKLDNIVKVHEVDTNRLDKLDDDSSLQKAQVASIESQQKKLKQDVEGTKDKLQEISESGAKELTPRLKHLASVTKLYVRSPELDDIYVATHAHENAKEILNSTGCVILTGSPGEGKTAMAIQLINETMKTDSCLKLSTPSDWDDIDLDNKMFDMIFIDDIFGAGAFDEKLFEGWLQRLQDIDKAIQAKVIQVVITTRHYILKEAKERLRQLTLFKEENIQQLASFDLTGSERAAIIEKHLKHAQKEYSSFLINSCSETYERAFTFNKDSVRLNYDLPEEFDEYLRKDDSVKAMIGFPEIVSLFVGNEHLFEKGSFFFAQPLLFFRKCMEELFLDEEKFLALILIWTQPNKQLQQRNIDPPYEMQWTALQFGIRLENKTKKIFKSLKYHKDGFLRFDSVTGNYSFKHSIVKDMVGLVAGKEYPDAVLQFADEEFILQYVTTDETKNDGLHIFVEEYKYQELLKAICRVMKQGRFRRYLIFFLKIRDYEIRKQFGDVPGLRLHNEITINTSVLKHDCFGKDVFVEMFFKCNEGKYFLSKPVDILPDECTAWNCNIVFGEYIPVYLPSLALLYAHSELLKRFLKKKLPRTFNKALFLHSTLIIASRQGMKDVIEILLLHGAVVCEDMIYLAAGQGHSDSLEYLLQSREGSLTAYTNNKNRNSPLIAAVKRGSVPCIKSLLRHGADINYRNRNNWSALDKAILNRQSEACQVLLENKAQVNCKTGIFKRTPLHMHADIHIGWFYMTTSLHMNADIRLSPDITELLLQYGASITATDYRGHNPIHCAAFRNHNDVVEILLKADVSRVTVNRRVSYGRNSVIKGADLFHIAVFKNNASLVDMLLENNISPNVRDFYGQTPVYRAICQCKQEVNTELVVVNDQFTCIMKEVMDIIFKVRPDKYNRAKTTNYSYCEIIKKLVPISDVRQAERHGYTPLHAAVHKGLTEIAKLLCPLVDVNARDRYGKTPLHTACEQLDLDIFKILIEDYGADYRMRTQSGLSVFDILENKTSWKSICRRYKAKKPVETHMLETPPYASFRKIIAAKDPEFAMWTAKPATDASSG